MGIQALAGIRVADLGIITAGAATTQFLADFGADVIKVESATYYDPFRQWTQVSGSTPATDNLEMSPFFQTVNRNKRGISVNLKHPRGREVFLRLVAVSDVVVENFRRGVMERMGLGFEDLRRVRPDLVMLSLASQGNEGPESKYISYGSTLDALGGLMALTGYDATTPTWSSNNLNYPDQVVSMLAPGILLAALRYRNLTGEGVFIDFSQRELVTSLIGEFVLDYTVNGQLHEPIGNRHPAMALQGCYPCQGEDQWIALTAETDEQWHALCHCMERADLADDPRFATVMGRWHHQALLDQMIEAWTPGQGKQDVMARLQAVGVPAGAVLSSVEAMDNPQLQGRDFFQSVDHPIAGRQMQRGFAAHLSRTPGSVCSPAPCMGEHTSVVLTELLGYTAEEVRALARDGAVQIREFSR